MTRSGERAGGDSLLDWDVDLLTEEERNIPDKTGVRGMGFVVLERSSPGRGLRKEEIGLDEKRTGLRMHAIAVL